MPKLDRKLNTLDDDSLWSVVGAFKKSQLVRWLRKRMAAAGFPPEDVQALGRATKGYLVELAVDEIRDPW